LFTATGSIDSLAPLAHPFGASSMSLGSRRLHSRLVREIAEQLTGRLAHFSAMHDHVDQAVLFENEKRRDPLLVQVGQKFVHLQQQEVFSRHRL